MRAEAKEQIRRWVKQNTKGLKKGFDKNALIFSYNNIYYDLADGDKQNESN